MWAIYKHEDFKLPFTERDKLYNSVLEESYLDPEYLTMLGLSALIALFGLLQNSAAVIIGAMLISPLMNPILAAALALTLGDGPLGRKSAAVLSLSVGGAIAITWLLATFVPLKQATPEILARTNPNLLDLGIAVFSGLAGTLALRSHKAGLMIIPGVAIAVAVIPPLAVAGYAVSNHLWGAAAGAFLLFVTNLVSIIISAAVIFLLMGFRPHRLEEGRLKLKYRLAISAGVLAVLSIPLIQTLHNAVRQVGLRSEIQQTLDRRFKSDHSSVTDVNFSRTHQGLVVHGTLRTTEYFDDEHIHDAEESLRSIAGSNTRLEIDQILVTQGGLTPQAAARIRNFISAGVVQPAPNAPEPPFDFQSNQDKILTFLQGRVDETLAGTPLKRTGELKAQLGRPVVLRLDLAAAEPLENQTVQMLAAQLSTRLSAGVELHGRVTLQGAAYKLKIESPSTRRILTLKDRLALAKLVALALQRPGLSVEVKVAESGAPAHNPPPLAHAVETVLSRSRLNPSRWKIETVASPPAAASGPVAQTVSAPSASGRTPTPAAAPVAHCDFQVIQEF